MTRSSPTPSSVFRQVTRFSWVATPGEAGVRLDRYLAARETLGTRSQVKRLIDTGFVRIDGQLAKPSVVVRAGQQIEVEVPRVEEMIPIAEAIPLEVLYEDDSVLAVNKPAGLVVHPAPGHWSGTLVSALRHRWGERAHDLDPARMGLVHRLDKDTSGVLLIGKSMASVAALGAQFKKRKVEKEYVALVWGKFFRHSGVIEKPIARHPRHRKKMAVRSAGRAAVTRYEVVEQFARGAFVKLFPETGRTHQIRVHLAAIGHPVVADSLYGRARAVELSIKRHALHAAAITFRSPATREIVRVTAPLPGDFENALATLRAMG